MSITADLSSLNAGATIELFVLDATAQGGAINYFHAGTNGIDGPVVWQGRQYIAWPVQAKGFDKSSTGALPRPTVSMANVNGIIGAMARDFGDLLGAKVTRKRTFVKYLDDVNFPRGNPTADPSAYLPDDIYFVDQKTLETKDVIEFALAAKMDLEGVQVPQRVIVQTCVWQYRGEGCGYVGGPVADINDVATTDPSADSCSKHLSGCKLRFGANNTLPFGGFPGAALLR